MEKGLSFLIRSANMTNKNVTENFSNLIGRFPCTRDAQAFLF